MINYKTVSMCVSSNYCKGWNDAIEAIKAKENISRKVMSMCPTIDYCNGWNDVVKEFNQKNDVGKDK